MEKKNIVTRIGTGVLLSIAILFFCMLTDKKDDKPKNDDSCQYSELQLKSMSLKYFTNKNGEKTEKGQNFEASIQSLNDEEYVTIISHLEQDHITTDARYVINCKNGKAILEDNSIVDFTK